MTQPSNEVSAWWYLAGGGALGIAVGLLIAPRALAELREKPDFAVAEVPEVP